MELFQTHTSKNTSINKEKFPRIYTHINWGYLKGMSVLDYGCGRYTEHIKKLMWLYDIEWHSYDPYWQIDSLNEEALHSNPDIVICSNVFNVLDNYRDVTRIHDYIRSFTQCLKEIGVKLERRRKKIAGREMSLQRVTFIVMK